MLAQSSHPSREVQQHRQWGIGSDSPKRGGQAGVKRSSPAGPQGSSVATRDGWGGFGKESQQDSHRQAQGSSLGEQRTAAEAEEGPRAETQAP